MTLNILQVPKRKSRATLIPYTWALSIWDKDHWFHCVNQSIQYQHMINENDTSIKMYNINTIHWNIKELSDYLLGVLLISQFCRFDIPYNFYWYSEYIDIHYIVIMEKPCVIASFIFSMDFPVQCPNRHNYGTNQLIKMFLPTELCATSVHISTLFLNMSI